MRYVNLKLNIDSNCDGSACVELGGNVVSAYVKGPTEIKGKMRGNLKGVVNCEFCMAEFATSDRRKRTKYDRLSQDVGAQIKQTFETVLLLDKIPRSQIDIYVHVTEADGGMVSAAINAVTLALVDAGVPMSDIVSASTCGLIDNQPVVDMNSLELSSGSPEMLLAIVGTTNQIVLLDIYAKIPPSQFDQVYQQCEKAASLLMYSMKTAIRDYAQKRLHG
eukprot:GHVL01028610.1.p1 GENE.GHVL01028610.1~~GHVL01028610.1.p1  ORF type:complete len:220 (-),score=37.04 GHVL01028610.1:265-924(-)